MQGVVKSIREAYIEFVKQKIDSMNIREGMDNYIQENSYIDSKITADINKSKIHWKQCDFTFMDVSVSIKLGKVEGMEDLLVFYTCFLIYLFVTHMKKTMKRIYLTLIGYEGQKRLPEEGHKLTPFEINGGVTWYGALESNIIVFRKEEMIKVLTHEMIHAFNIDAKYISEYDEMFLNDYFSIHCKSVTINESFTDALAVLINTVVFSHLKRKEDFDKEFRKNLRLEQDHMKKQACKVLKFYGYRKEKGKLLIDRPICEKTHTISYYVVKSIVYSNFSEFCNLLEKNNMCIDSQAYIQFVRNKLDTYVKNLHFDVKLTKNLKMTTLDIGENYIKLRSHRDISKRKDGTQD